jgi:hypothetical protein
MENDVDDREMEESLVSSEDDEDASEDEHELEPELSSVQVQNSLQSKLLLCEASTQTDVASGEQGTMTDMIVTPEHPTPFISTRANASRSANDSLITNKKEVLQSTNVANGRSRTQIENIKTSNGHHFLEEHMLVGGMPAESQPRRHVQKYGSMIRPACLKMTKEKKVEK